MSEILYGLSYEDYAARPGINASLLNIVDRFSLMHAKAYIDGKLDKDSDAKDFGKPFHSLVLENRVEFVVPPETYTNSKGEVKPWNWNSNTCKAWGNAQTKTVLTRTEADDLQAMAKSIRADERISFDGKSEVSVFAEINGLPVKARIDLLRTSGPIMDFKSAYSAQPNKFVRNAFDLGYFLQAAFYLDVLAAAGDRRDAFWLIPIEKDYPYSHSIITLGDGPISFIEMGRRRYQTALYRLAEAMKKHSWPAYGSIDGELAASPWMLKELEDAV